MLSHDVPYPLGLENRGRELLPFPLKRAVIRSLPNSREERTVNPNARTGRLP
jgi:hypothetical protein